MSGRLKDKIAIVTGAAPRAPGLGNGKAVALMFAREGASVVLVNRDADRAEELRAEIEGEGGKAAVFAGDVTDEAAARDMAAFAVDQFGGLDILVNNVGYGAPARADNIDVETWRRIIDVNLTGALLTTKHAIAAMRASPGGGSVINVSSVAGSLGLQRETGAVAYAASKAGMHGLTLSVAADYAAEGIRCNCLVVGTVNTPLVAGLGEDGLQRRREAVPLKTDGTGWDVAYAALFLASDESRWITGAFLPVDGGLLAIREWPM